MLNKSMTMKAEGSLIAFENGRRKQDVEMKADYDGNDLEISVNDVLHNKKSQIQLSNEDLFDIMIKKQPSEDLMTRLQKQLKHSTPPKSNLKTTLRKRKNKRKYTIRKHKKNHTKRSQLRK